MDEERSAPLRLDMIDQLRTAIAFNFPGFFRIEESFIVDAELKRTAKSVIDKIRQLRDSL
jgi:hypothetical protein